MWFRWLSRDLLVWFLLVSTVVSGRRFGCPARVPGVQCYCIEKSRGLDIFCERSNIDKIRSILLLVAEQQDTIMYLKLINNYMGVLAEDILYGLDIKHLLVHEANISSIHRDAFQDLGDRLESLDLSKNHLTEIPTEAFEALKALVSLNLSLNRITMLRSESFRGLVSLIRLTLYGNRLHTLDSAAFLSCGNNLTRLNIGRNNLTRIPAEALALIAGLQHLDLHENNITQIETEHLPEELDKLNLAENQISEVGAGALKRLTGLVSLDLTRNNIDFIHPDAFREISGTMEWLKLGFNRLDEVPSEPLRDMIQLRELDLRGNNISKLESYAFSPFGANLKFLYMMHNRIASLSPEAFANLPHLEWLYLNHNRLRVLHRSVFEKITDTLVILDVHDNPLDCDCSLSWFYQYAHSSSGKIVVSLPLETKCSAPSHLKGISFKRLDMACLNSSGNHYNEAERNVAFVITCFINLMLNHRFFAIS
ncbi:chondroadherin-like protein isoform X2 [Varroa destructor]|nr:chondroadherin-like protein isoform X2 [Varroa destructor]